jgi:pyruvyl transferase EpsO
MEHPTTAPDLCGAQRAELDRVLSEVIPAGPVALADFPSFGNIGDSAIWLGEVETLGRLGVAAPRYVCDLSTFQPEMLRRRLGESGTILLHGGGNFGDLWPKHQEFREQILAEFPDRQIIQMPQSLCFQSSMALEKARRVVNAHRRFTLLVRDRESSDLARRNFDVPVHLCPDAAFGIAVLPATGAPLRPVLWLSRGDHESPGQPVRAARANAPGPVDWIKEPASMARRFHGWVRRLAMSRRVPSSLFLDLLRVSYNGLAGNRVARGCRLLAEGSVVVANRLHAHIICLQLGIPHFLSDTRYGKIQAYYDTWTFSSGLATMCASEADALEQALASVERGGGSSLKRPR